MKITLKGELTDLNTHIAAERNNRYTGGSVKKNNTNEVLKQLTLKEIVKEYPVFIKFTWITKNLKKDPDNISFAKKYILDALVIKGILENDARRQISGFQDMFAVDKSNPRIEIELL